ERKILLLRQTSKNNTLKITEEIANWTNLKKSPLESILKATISSLTRKDKEKYSVPIIIALEKLKLNSFKFIQNLPEETASENIKYLLSLKDEKDVFEAALSTYDTVLTLQVLSHCKFYDMEEIFPFLKRIDSKSETEKKFETNMYLGRYNKALFYLSRCDRFSDCLSLIQRYQLYEAAFKIWSVSGMDKKKNPDEKANEDEWFQIAKLYAQYLEDKDPFA
ncbi:hypothetical protein MHBO_004577, partial [Bonamia ostreae]